MLCIGSDGDNHTNIPNEDAGAKARAAIERREKAYRFARRLVGTLVVLTILVFSAAGIYANNLWEKRTTGYSVDERPCHAEIQKQQLTGKRTYSYPYIEFLGFRFLETKKVEEKTWIDVNGSAFTVVGVTGTDQSWSTRVSKGEKGVQLLKRYDTYVFVFDDGSVGAVNYQSLCK